jgi:hypothetical protein
MNGFDDEAFPFAPHTWIRVSATATYVVWSKGLKGGGTKMHYKFALTQPCKAFDKHNHYFSLFGKCTTGRKVKKLSPSFSNIIVSVTVKVFGC